MKIDINEDLLAEAQKLIGIDDKKTVIENALRLFISVNEKQEKLIDLWGKVEIDEEAYE